METTVSFVSNKDILANISQMKNIGFDQIRLPGGTDKNFDHYSGVVVFCKNPENKKIYFLGIPYNSNFFQNQKEDRSRKVEGETPKATARRELWEETGILAEESSFTEICEARFVGKNNNGPGDHTKYFFLLSSFQGKPLDFQGGNPIEGETGTPIWIPGQLFKQVLSSKHKRAFQKALELMAQERNIYFDILDLL